MDIVQNTYALEAGKLPEIQVAFKSKLDLSLRRSIGSSKETFELCKSIWDQDTIELREEFIVFYLNRGNKPIGYYKLNIGTATASCVDLQLLFAVALKCRATRIVVAHNHPSGILIPSSSDKRTMTEIKQIANLFNIDFLDSLIVSATDYYSFADNGEI